LRHFSSPAPQFFHFAIQLLPSAFKMSKKVTRQSFAKSLAVASNENNPNHANLKKMEIVHSRKFTIEEIKCFNEDCSNILFITASSVVVRCDGCESILCLTCPSMDCKHLSEYSDDDEMQPNIQQTYEEHRSPKKTLLSNENSNETDNEDLDPPVPTEEFLVKTESPDEPVNCSRHGLSKQWLILLNLQKKPKIQKVEPTFERLNVHGEKEYVCRVCNVTVTRKMERHLLTKKHAENLVSNPNWMDL